MRSGLYSKKYISSIMLLVLACKLLWLPGCRRVSMAREDDGYGDLFLCGDLAVQSAKFECVPCAGKKERATADVASRLQLKGKAGPAEVFVAGSIGMVLILAVMLVFLAKKKNDGHP